MAMALAQHETVHLISQSTDKNHRFNSGSEVQDYLPYSSSYNPQASINTHFNTSKRLLHIVLATLLTLTERIQRLCVIPERSLFHIHVFSLDSYVTHSIVVFSLDLAVLFMNPKTRNTTAPWRPEFDCQISFVSQLVCRSVWPSTYLCLRAAHQRVSDGSGWIEYFDMYLNKSINTIMILLSAIDPLSFSDIRDMYYDARKITVTKHL